MSSTPDRSDAPFRVYNLGNDSNVGLVRFVELIEQVMGRSAEKVEGVRAMITKNFDKQIQRGRATEEQKTEVLGRVTGTTSLDDLAGAVVNNDFVERAGLDFDDALAQLGFKRISIATAPEQEPRR